MDRLFLLLKPDAAAHEPEIVYKLGQAGFKIFNRRRTRLTPTQSAEFFSDWSSDPDFDALLAYTTSGPVVALALLRHDGVNALKRVVFGGAADEGDHPPAGESLSALYASRHTKRTSPTTGTTSNDPTDPQAPTDAAADDDDALHDGFYIPTSPETVERDLRFFFPDTPVNPPPTSDTAKQILETTVYPTLLQGLTQLCKEKPANPTVWLGQWLTDNNPNKPRVVEPPVGAGTPTTAGGTSAGGGLQPQQQQTGGQTHGHEGAGGVAVHVV
ncbi:nucleoside diphosphate kinase [Fimicolochytrium jonesii]|uniref:nucleoside diphosphate kinase n=1 Tax=Fimicolochytrium jonesii TaxID=1396493 RepID=UPI0022FED480|nr:nucleoside diphosphate kinase [Fimicolochytrium jonesii]KAI8816633.1 nucleoside diphosphate kinase [Fimicolochytrium jonesii]